VLHDVTAQTTLLFGRMPNLRGRRTLGSRF
jgi:hypothetical protein